jgi:DNA invertase Pin-like site-specific DNA recombinase
MIQNQNYNNITALYLRVSKDDLKGGKINESNSITNQRIYLRNYAEKHGFRNIQEFVDDGITGTTNQRQEYRKMIEMAENGEISSIIVKDLSRFGRDAVEQGLMVERILPLHEVKLISILDGIDTSEEGHEIHIQMLGIMNENYARDIGRKVKAAMRAKSSQKLAIGIPPYGYKRDESNKNLWVIDPEAAEIVRWIFQKRLERESITWIVKELRYRKIAKPVIYSKLHALGKNNKEFLGDFIWTNSTIDNILKNCAYCGDIVNFKTFRKFKIKKIFKNQVGNLEIHKNVHEPIISREDFEEVQKTFKAKPGNSKTIEKNIFSGFLKCAGCGANLNYKTNFGYSEQENHFFSCKNHRAKNGLCSKSHHIRADFINEYVKNHIVEIVKFANEFEDEFVKIATNENYKRIQATQKKNRKKFDDLLLRQKDIDRIIENLYEDKVSGVINEERFTKMSNRFEDEQLEVKQQIKNLEKTVNEESTHELNSDKFLATARKFAQIEKLDLQILQAFIDHITVGHYEMIDGFKHHEIEICYKFVGNVTLPHMPKQVKNQILKVFSRQETHKKRIAV